MMSGLFYRAVIQAVFLFGLESWVMLDAMIRAVEGTHVGFLHQIMGKRARRKSHRAWETPAAEKLLRVERMQLAAK